MRVGAGSVFNIAYGNVLWPKEADQEQTAHTRIESIIPFKKLLIDRLF